MIQALRGSPRASIGHDALHGSSTHRCRENRVGAGEVCALWRGAFADSFCHVGGAVWLEPVDAARGAASPGALAGGSVRGRFAGELRLHSGLVGPCWATDAVAI